MLNRLVVLSGLALVVTASAAGVLLFHAWHIDPARTVTVAFSEHERPAKTMLGLLMRRADYALQVCCSHSTSVIRSLPGARGPARKFEVRPTDPVLHDGIRSELRLRPNRLNQAYWYQGRIYVPSGWVVSSEPVIVMQWHNTRDILIGDAPTRPPLALYIVGRRWQIVRTWNNRWITPTAPPRVEGVSHDASLAMVPGRWTEWTFHVRWSAGTDGHLRAWKDGALVVDTDGPTAHRDLIGPYLKAGLYIPGWSNGRPEPDIPARTIYFDTLAASADKRRLPLPIEPFQRDVQNPLHHRISRSYNHECAAASTLRRASLRCPGRPTTGHPSPER